MMIDDGITEIDPRDLAIRVAQLEERNITLQTRVGVLEEQIAHEARLMRELRKLLAVFLGH